MPSWLAGVLRELALRLELGRRDLVEHRVLGTLLGRDAHAERDPARDLAHDLLDAAERVKVDAGQRGAGGLVAASDVVADTRGRDVALVGDRAADWLAVAGVVVGAEHAVLGVAGVHAALELLEAPLVDVAERLDVHCSNPPLWLSFRQDTGRIRTAVDALCRRALHHSATVSWRAPERSRTSASGFEARRSSSELRGRVPEGAMSLRVRRARSALAVVVVAAGAVKSRRCYGSSS